MYNFPLQCNDHTNTSRMRIVPKIGLNRLITEKISLIVKTLYASCNDSKKKFQARAEFEAVWNNGVRIRALTYASKFDNTRQLLSQPISLDHLIYSDEQWFTSRAHATVERAGWGRSPVTGTEVS